MSSLCGFGSIYITVTIVSHRNEMLHLFCLFFFSTAFPSYTSNLSLLPGLSDSANLYQSHDLDDQTVKTTIKKLSNLTMLRLGEDSAHQDEYILCGWPRNRNRVVSVLNAEERTMWRVMAEGFLMCNRSKIPQAGTQHLSAWLHPSQSIISAKCQESRISRMVLSLLRRGRGVLQNIRMCWIKC